MPRLYIIIYLLDKGVHHVTQEPPPVRFAICGLVNSPESSFWWAYFAVMGKQNKSGGIAKFKLSAQVAALLCEEF